MFYISVQTILVYLLLLAIMYLFCRKSASTNRFVYAIFGLLIYSVIFGLRYGVGRDCISYIMSYQEVLNGYKEIRFEPGFVWIEETLASLNAPSYVFMSFLSFVQLFFIFCYFKDKKIILPYIVLTFFLGCSWLTYANGIRQVISFCLFVYSLKFVTDRRIVLHYLFLIVSYFIHRSSIVLFFFYPLLLLDKDWTPKRRWQFLIFFVSILLGRMEIINNMMGYLDTASVYLGYHDYMDERFAEKMMTTGLSYGIGYYINILIPLFLIYKSTDVKLVIPFAKMFYNFFFIGIIIRFMFFGSSLIQRINYYFYGFDFLIAALTLFVLSYFSKRKEYSLLLTLEFLVLVGTLYSMFQNNSAFYFFWQEDLFNQYSLPNITN